MRKVSKGRYEGQREDGRKFEVVNSVESVGWNLTATETDFGSDAYIYSYDTKKEAVEGGMDATATWWTEA